MVNSTKEAVVEQIKKVKITENQMKVIRTKYLRDAPNVEAWLEGVAANIALTEILHVGDEKKVFEGVSYKIEKKKIGKHFSKSFLLHSGLDHNEKNANFDKLISNLMKLAKEDDTCAKAWEDAKIKFFNLMARWDFLPNSPTLMNAGRKLQQLSACYVLPVGDSMEEIYDGVKNMALVHQGGGGTGFDFSRLRPEGDAVKSTKGVASGPVSFMQIFDKSTDVVKQGGTRRGANMGILRYDHPDILKFIDAKKTAGVLENFNVSVAIDGKFMTAVKEKKDYDLLNPRRKEAVGRLNARDVFDKLVHGAWETGDPGIVIVDRINNTNSNPTPHIGQIESTNPCGEQPLLPYEVCNLGSINLNNCVLEDGSDLDWDRLREITHVAVHFLDNVIDVNNYPLAQIEYMAKSNRRIGLGIMGWAEALIKLGLPYDSEDALAKAEEVMKFVNDEALAKSEALGKERGIFLNWKNSIYDAEGEYFRGKDVKPRHSARTTIAPTGTIAIASGLQGSGIEPFFSLVYKRYTAAGIDALKKGEEPPSDAVLFEINNLFRKVAEDNNFFGMEENKLWEKIADNHGSLANIEEIPFEIKRLFLTSHDLNPLDHVRVQCAFQKYVDNAVSKTVNLKNEATVQDIEEVYMLAYNLGAKGVTVYRDGSKKFQILNTKKKSEQRTLTQQEEKKVKVVEKLEPRERPEIIKGTTYKINTGYGSLFVTVNDDEEGKPFEIFALTGKTGGVLAAKSEAICRLASLALRSGIDAEDIIDQLKGIRGPMPAFSKKGMVLSIPDAISKVLADHVNRGQTQLADFGAKQEKEKEKKDGIIDKFKKTIGISVADSGKVPECPECHNILEFAEGCEICHFCGYSKCG
jgi:ribonucleoside-diphosphate reductase alpha chain